MLSQDATIQGEFSSNHLSYLDSYWKNIDCQERKTLTDVITTRFFSWRTVVAESNRSPPSKQRLKETIAFIYFTKGAPSRCTNPKPLSHWLFKLQEREDLDFLRDLSPTLNLDAKDKLGNSALHWAVRNRAPKVVSALMSLDANPNVSNKAGDYPLHFAVHKDDPNSITALRALLNNQKINPSPRDRRNYTPLDIAVLHKKLGCVVALTENGARVNNKTFSLARDSLTGEQIETDMIQHLVLCRWKPK